MTHLLLLIKSDICHVVNHDLHGGKPVNKSVKCGFVFSRRFECHGVLNAIQPVPDKPTE